MNLEYIMQHTPAQIAAENSEAEIKSAFTEHTPFTLDWAADHLFAQTDPAEFADRAPDPAESEALLVEWYDECDEERPCSAEEMEAAHILYIAWYVRVDMDAAEAENRALEELDAAIAEMDAADAPSE